VLVDSQEAAYWDALPLAERGPNPATSVVAASDTYRVSLARVGADWKIAAIVRR